MAKKTAARSNKPYLVFGGVIAVLLLAYLFIIPGMLAENYKDKALPAQNKIAEKITVLGEQYKRPAYTKVDSTPAADKADYEATRKALNEARDTFNQQKADLTGFVTMPLMGLNGNYTDASNASRDAKEWVNKTEQMLAAGDADLTYFEKSNVLSAKYENIGQSMDSLTGEESLEVVAQKMEQATSEMQGALTEIKQLQPTESLKKSHDAEIVLVDKMIVQFKEISGALRAGDIDKADTLSTQIYTTMTELDNQTNQALVDYGRDATVNKVLTELNVLDRTLEDDFNRF